MNLYYNNIKYFLLFLKFTFLSNFLFFFILYFHNLRIKDLLQLRFTIRPFSINFYLRIWVTDRRVSTPLLLRATLLIFLSIQCFLKMSSHDEISKNTRRQQRWPRSIPDIAIFLLPHRGRLRVARRIN